MGFTVTEYVAPEAVNPYLENVAEFAKANEGNDKAAFAIDVPAKDQAKTELAVRKAANAVNKTARLRKVDTSKRQITGQTDKGKDILEGVVVLTFTLSEKHKGGRGRKPANGNGDAAPEAPKSK